MSIIYFLLKTQNLLKQLLLKAQQHCKGDLPDSNIEQVDRKEFCIIIHSLCLTSCLC